MGLQIMINYRDVLTKARTKVGQALPPARTFHSAFGSAQSTLKTVTVNHPSTDPPTNRSKGLTWPIREGCTIENTEHCRARGHMA